jgi:hypothetical protein
MRLGLYQKSNDKERLKSSSNNTSEHDKEEPNEHDYDEEPREINHTSITTNEVF